MLNFNYLKGVIKVLESRSKRISVRMSLQTYEMLEKLQCELKLKFNLSKVSQADCIEYLLKKYNENE